MSISFSATKKKTNGPLCIFPLNQTWEHQQHLNMKLETFASWKDPCCCEEARGSWCMCFWAGAARLLSTSNLQPSSRSCSPKWTMWPEVLASPAWLCFGETCNGCAARSCLWQHTQHVPLLLVSSSLTAAGILDAYAEAQRGCQSGSYTSVAQFHTCATSDSA